MDAQRFAHLTQIAECDDEVALQLESELALDLDIDAERRKADFDEWIEDQGNRYLAPKAAAPDPVEIEKLAEEIDF